MLGKIADLLHAFMKRRCEEMLIVKYGGIQRCPWCRQIAQSEKGWNFKTDPENVGYDILTCGVCSGTSRWFWGMGMRYMAAVNPPKPDRPDYICEKVD